MAQTKLVKGDKLTPEIRKQVLAAFTYRNTKENEANSKQVQPKVDCSQSDDQWLATHAFYITADGKLSNREKRCEPAYMANESNDLGGDAINYKGNEYVGFWDDVEEDELLSVTASAYTLEGEPSDYTLKSGEAGKMEAIDKSGKIVAVLDKKKKIAYMINESKVNESIDTNISTELLSSQTLDTGTKLNKGDKVTIDITDKPGSTFRLISVSVNGKHVGYVETETPGSIFKLDGITESDNSVWITGETMLRSKNPEYKGKAYPFANMMNGTDVYVHDTDNGGIQMFLGKDSDVEVANESVNESASAKQGGFSDAVWKVPFLQKYVNSSLVFGYVGSEIRTDALDKSLESELRGFGCNDMMIAAFIISDDGRKVSSHLLDTDLVFKRFIGFQFDDVPGDWKKFQNDPKVFQIFESVKPAKRVNESKFTVSLSNVGNIDHDENPDKPIPGTKDEEKSIGTYKEAVEACKSYIKNNDLGAGNWTGGDIQSNGKTVAKISYNGRVWDMSGKEIKDIDKSITESKRTPLPTFESFRKSVKIQESDEAASSVLAKVFGGATVDDEISKNWEIKRKSISDDSKVKEYVDGLKADGYKTKIKRNSDFTYIVGVKAKAGATNESKEDDFQSMIDELFKNSNTPNMKLLKGTSSSKVYDGVTSILFGYFQAGKIDNWEAAEMKVSNDPAIGEILATIED